MKLIRSLSIAGLLTPLATSVLGAGEMENIFVTGAYAPVPRADLSSSVSVLDEEFLKAINKRSVADALRTVPGLLVEEMGGPGGLTAVSIRGGESNFTVVLVDGVELNDPTNTRGGSFDFSNIDMASIERIEIVRGPQSAVYGSGALAGVINIITRRSTEQHQQRVTGEWGEDEYSHYALAATGSFGQLGYSLQLAKRDSGETTEGSERDHEEATLGLDWSPSDAHHLKLNYRYLDGQSNSFPEQSGGPEYAVSRELDDSVYTDSTVAASWGWHISTLWHSELAVSRFEHDENYSSPGIYPYFSVPPQLSDTEFTRDQFRWVNSLEISDGLNIAVGADYRDEEGDSKGELDFGGFPLATDFLLDRSTTGLFIDGRARVLPAVLLQGSVRYDDSDEFSAETTFKVGGRYDVTPQLAVLANWGEGFKLPSFFALGHALVGNPDLVPETAESWDIGLQWAAVENFSIEASYFANDYENLVDFDSELFINVNRKQVETQGAELQINWSPLETLSVQGHATYTDIDVKGDASPLLGRPDWNAGATAVWQVATNWRAALDYQWVGEQYASSLHTGDTVVETLDDYHRVDFTLGWQVLEWAAVELALDNVLDEDYYNAVGFPGPGRGVRVALTLSNM